MQTLHFLATAFIKTIYIIVRKHIQSTQQLKITRPVKLSVFYLDVQREGFVADTSTEMWILRILLIAYAENVC